MSIYNNKLCIFNQPLTALNKLYQKLAYILTFILVNILLKPVMRIELRRLKHPTSLLIVGWPQPTSIFHMTKSSF